MCGLLGVVSQQTFDQNKWRIASDLQAHRGPDDCGNWRGKVNDWHIQLGHQRLAILDLSPKGAQPMIHPRTQSVLVFNGEIYNFVELRSELENIGLLFEGSSDSEVLLQALEHWGLDETLSRLNGMWAFAWLDINQQQLHLTRDRCGEKPLYWAKREKELYFASELKTLLTLLGDHQTLNLQAVGEYLEQGLIDTDVNTFISGVQQVRSGARITFSVKSDFLSGHEQTYWTCPIESDSILAWEPFLERLRDCFTSSIRMRLRSDVPVGILLSGGLDSSSIAGVAKAIGANNLQLLSAVSDDARFDESPFIDCVAQHLDWQVTKVRLPDQPEQLFTHLEQATWFMDAPVGSLSNVAHYLLMKAAKEQGITVVLSGQGADELLCGYRKFLGFYLQSLVRNSDYWEALKTLGNFWANRTIINQFSWAEAKRYLPAILRTGNLSIRGPALQEFRRRDVGLPPNATLSQRQHLDLMSLSVPTLNHFEDRMSMAWSREIRLPFLDPNLIELLIPAPPKYKLNNGWTKYAMRCAMKPFLPDKIIWRKDKQGFVNPQSEWIKGKLRDKIIEDFFNPDSLIFNLGIVDRLALLKLYNKFCLQKQNQGSIFFRDIFSAIGLETWLRKFQIYL